MNGIDLTKFDAAPELEVRAATRDLDGLIIVGGSDDKVATHNLFRLHEWAIDDPHLSFVAGQNTPSLVGKFVAPDQTIRPLDHQTAIRVFLNYSLHLLSRYVRKIRGVLVQQQHEL